MIETVNSRMDGLDRCSKRLQINRKSLYLKAAKKQREEPLRQWSLLILLQSLPRSVVPDTPPSTLDAHSEVKAAIFLPHCSRRRWISALYVRRLPINSGSTCSFAEFCEKNKQNKKLINLSAFNSVKKLKKTHFSSTSKYLTSQYKTVKTGFHPQS